MPDPTIENQLNSCEDKLEDLNDALDDWYKQKLKEDEISRLEAELNDKLESIEERDDYIIGGAVVAVAIIAAVATGGVALAPEAAEGAVLYGGLTTIQVGILATATGTSISTMSAAEITLRIQHAGDDPALKKMSRDLEAKRNDLGDWDREKANKDILDKYDKLCECEKEIHELEDELDAADELPKGSADYDDEEDDEELPEGSFDLEEANSVAGTKGSYFGSSF